jgi:mono/diheme cytochrome c family protein
MLVLVVLAAVVLGACGGGDGESDGADPPGVLAGGDDLYRGACQACHGAGGGGGVGPGLGEVVTDFPDCEEHVRWVRLGSSRWEEEVGPTYGATGREVKGGMPGYESSFSDSEIRLVTAWHRYRFGGQDPQQAAEACGVGE